MFRGGRNIFSQVRRALAKFPAVGNALTYGSLFCTAELTQQIILKKYLPSQEGGTVEDLDTEKVKRYAFLGYCIFPNMMTVWYKWLDTRYTATTSSVIVKKVFLDQTCLTIPILFIFFTSMSYFEGKDDLTAEFFQRFPVTYATSCAFWLPAQVLNFKFVPPAYRIAYNGACGFIWANILCMLKRQGEALPVKSA